MQDLCADPQAGVKREAAHSRLLYDAVEVRSHYMLSCMHALYESQLHVECAWLLSSCSGCWCHSIALPAVKAAGPYFAQHHMGFLEFPGCMHNLQLEISCFCAAQVTLICHHHKYGCVVKVKADDDEDAEEAAKQQQEYMWTLDEEVVADCMQR